ncbi:MAG: hypothetical protein BWY76_00309 [bacterium ADurb.Bin429]|nr:MAG: hypothetical protein BWY76_00309 [bacterium ADurb.Bin429]
MLRNASDLPYDGYVEHEPWLGWGWHTDLHLEDEDGAVIPAQIMQSEAANRQHFIRLLFPITLAPGEIRAIRIVRKQVQVLPGVSARLSAVSTNLFSVAPDANVIMLWERKFSLPRLDLIEDDTDNWSHGVDRFPDAPVISPIWDAPTLIDYGPLMGSLVQTGRIGDSTLRAEWRVYADQPFIELRLRVYWRATKQLLKLSWELPGLRNSRIDGIPGGSLRRENDGREVPLRDWMLLRTMTIPAAIISSNIFAVDVTPFRVRLTLLRSPLQTYHIPFTPAPERATPTDQGVHDFHIRFYAGEELTPEYLDQQAAMLHRSPIIADWTKGMERQ